jgi:dCMP deaminase
VSISISEFDREVMGNLKKMTKQSSDWWRQVASALVIDNDVKLFARNEHRPHDMQAYSDSDPRAHFQSGEQIEMSTSIHSEANLIAQAAKKGIKTEGASLYCTTFPCQVCAKLIAESGIKNLYYLEGYSQLDGENVLKGKGVKIIQVGK